MSVAFTAGDVARWCRGELVQGSGDAALSGATIDTRRVAAGDLFVAIRGERHDAHRFLDQALAAGAEALLVERGTTVPETAVPVVAVDDTTRALGALAAGHRERFDGPVVAITGSNGKTSTKEMCAAILGVVGPCHKNEGNLNNQFGLPLTLLRRPATAQALVVEIGMNHRGEIAPLAAIARPTVGVITNVGTAHIEHLGSRENIALEKGDLVAALEADAVAVLNADDPLVAAQAERTRARVVRFGRGAAADVRAEDVRFLGGEGFRFALRTPDGDTEVTVAGLSENAVANALAAAAAALGAGTPLDAVAKGLTRFAPVPGRMAPHVLASGATVIDDSYNANPQSTEAALRSLVSLRGTGRAFAVLGEMGELGETAAAAHRGSGALAAELALDGLWALGDHAEAVAAGATEAGLDADRVHVAASHETLAADLVDRLGRGDWVLVKGSRSMQMERVVHALRAAGESQ